MNIHRRQFLKSSLAFTSGLMLPSGVLKSLFQDQTYDRVIYGASFTRIITVVAAAWRGWPAVIVVPLIHPGGLTTGGFSQTDIGVEGEGVGGIYELACLL